MGTLVLALPVLADESINASLDKESCEIGESVSLSVEAQTDGDFTVPPQISVEYNPSRLQFDNCSCEYGGGGGGLVTINDTSATLDFTTLSGGTADFSITGVFSDSGESSTTTVSVNVNGDDTAAGTDGFATEQTGVAEGTVNTGDGRVVQTVFANEFMPSLFHKETCDYQGQTVECGKFDMGDITVLYTTDESGNDGKFMVYNGATSEMTDFRMIQGIENRFIIVLSECEGEIPAGYTKAVLDWNGQTLTAYMNPDASNGTATVFGGLSANDFFLVYAISSEGNKGWYQYDQNEGTYQRFFSLAGGEAGSSVSDSDGDLDGSSELFIDEYLPRKAQMIMLFVFAALTLILVVVVIILAVKCSDNYEYYGDDYYGDEDDDEGEEDDEEDGNAEDGESAAYKNSSKSKNGVESAASYVSRKMAEEEEEDEQEEEPVMSKREYREAMREEKWRKKEEKKAAKLRAKGFEETTPMDWASFNTEESDDGEDRRRYSKSRPPKYMQGKYADNEDENEEEINDEVAEDEDSVEAEDEETAEEETIQEESRKSANGAARRGDDLPPRKRAESENEIAGRRTINREEDARERQRRLFEQQQRIEEQQRIERESKLEEQEKEKQKFIAGQHEDEELDEDFQFEFLNF